MATDIAFALGLLTPLGRSPTATSSDKTAKTRVHFLATHLWQELFFT
jgi:hypothetical protein